jgi:hypothetical protein
MTKQYSFSLLPMLVAAVLAMHTPQTVGEEACGEFGTSVVFADSPAQAAKLALEKEKLVFVLHVSGLFEESNFT